MAFSLFGNKRLKEGLQATSQSFLQRIGKAVAGKSTVDDQVLDNLEEALISADVGVNTTLKIIDRLQQRVARDKYLGTDELNRMLKEEITALLSAGTSTTPPFELPVKPYVILVVGVNGVGKTTTIGKLAAQFSNRGYRVLLGAADTFRAAAVDQLTIWGNRLNIPVVSRGMHADPSAVAFDAVQEGLKQQADVVIIDTAGRLHTKVNLMNELSKIRRSVQKVLPDAPHEVLLVLDGSTGQNAVHQAREFTRATQVNALAITKLDGTARGGVVIGICDEFRLPVKYIGVGEKAEDLQAFDAASFVDSLFEPAA
ncbi:MAG: signal recognition particle receptor FtsY [Cyclobacteriaceae bacterium]|nr:MAG: signal recognition particle receptor FtsY [Cyclobacteriaceae bacterium]